MGWDGTPGTRSDEEAVTEACAVARLIGGVRHDPRIQAGQGEPSGRCLEPEGGVGSGVPAQGDVDRSDSRRNHRRPHGPGVGEACTGGQDSTILGR